MKLRLTMNLSPRLRAAIHGNVSATIDRAIKEAHREPEKLVLALRRRIEEADVDVDVHPEKTHEEDGGEKWVRISFTHDPEAKSYMESLSRMTQLPVEQVVRLSIEAYINASHFNQPRSK